MEHIFNKIKLDDKEFSFPVEYLKAKQLPDDPPDSVVFEKDTREATNVVMLFFINKSEAMPFDNKNEIITCLHNHYLGKSQGLIEVEIGKTGQGTPFVYTIVKTAKQPSGVQYVLTLQIDYGVHVLNLQGYFEEEGTTGLRDAAIFEIALRDGIISRDDWSKWCKDPYNAELKTGCLMNLSEDKKYDEAFPRHPLTELRRFASFVITQN